MKCNECRYLAFDYVEDRLSPETRELFDKHMEECLPCNEMVAKMRNRKTEEEKVTGLFWYLLRPAGGFKRFFFIGALLTFVLVAALISIHVGRPFYELLF